MRYCFLLLISVILIPSCAKIELSGKMDTVEFAIQSHFDGVVVEDAIEVQMLKDCKSPSVTSDINVLPYIEIREDHGMLRIRYSKDFSVQENGYRLHSIVVLPFTERLSSLELSGASSFSCDETFAQTHVSIELSGASSATCRFDVKTLALRLSGASVLNAEGKISDSRLQIDGASVFRGLYNSRVKLLNIENCQGDISGASSASFFSNGTISCRLTGASLIKYSGSADISSSEISDSSSIIEKNI